MCVLTNGYFLLFESAPTLDTNVPSVPPLDRQRTCFDQNNAIVRLKLSPCWWAFHSSGLIYLDHSVTMAMPEGIEVREISHDVGRGLFAQRAFESGQALFEESPLISAQFCWNEAYGYSCCHFCMTPLEDAQENIHRLTRNSNWVVPHPQCNPNRLEEHVQCPDCLIKYCSKDAQENIQRLTRNSNWVVPHPQCNPNRLEEHVQCPDCLIKYCSSGCQERAWHLFHKSLCRGMAAREANESEPWSKLLNDWRAMHYPPETTSITLLTRILASILQSNQPDTLKAQYLSFMHATVSSDDNMAHKILGDGFSHQLEHLRQALVPLFPQPEVAQFLSLEGFRTLFALVGRNGQGVATSPWSHWVKNVEALPLSDAERGDVMAFIDQVYEALDAESGSFLDNEGSGLFLLQSLCNHSCVPNAQIEFPFNNHVLMVKAIRPIQAGEEILISYLDDHQLERSRHSRRAILSQNYLFSCSCPKCQSQADDPDETSEEEMSEDEQ
ncbi:hypothetical protein TCAL_00173 [Tigriopus californicus]|uniref:SET domain-containing protein n=1 Tax=Tigriopus californicus TaxID=6832 RepID=A0A553P2K1_TIGCA|nr:hypothetical protein TCAL_00173 [Tigriopus californicus]